MATRHLGKPRFATRAAVVALAGVLALAVVPALAGQHGATVSAAVNRPDVGSQQPGIAFESPNQMNADLNAMVAEGATWVRADFFWDALEPQRGQFSWTATDNFVAAAHARGLSVLAIADYTPAWARTGPTDKYPPTNPSDYAAFVAAAAAHYAPLGMHAWEIWNEPNNAMFWAPRADPTAYTTLLKLADTAIKQADPAATVVTGGLSPAVDNGTNVAPLTFLASIYAHGGQGSFDAVGYHPYSYPYAPMYPADWNTFYRTPAVHALMAANGDGNKTIWGTEVGFGTGNAPGSVSAATQATDITAAIAQWTSWSFHGPIFFYTIRDIGTDASNIDDNMGMLDHSGTPKQVFSSVQIELQAPRNVHAASVNDGAAVTWSPPAYDYGQPITGYRVIAKKSGASVTVSGAARSVDFALGTGTTDEFSVVPLRGSDAGISSALSNVVTPVPAVIVPGVGKATKPHTGTVVMRVPVTLDRTSAVPVTVHYQTKSVPPRLNARPSIDYVRREGTLVIPAGQTTGYVNVTIQAHALNVWHDEFFVQFSAPVGGTLGGYYGLGIGIIS